MSGRIRLWTTTFAIPNSVCRLRISLSSSGLRTKPAITPLQRASSILHLPPSVSATTYSRPSWSSRRSMVLSRQSPLATSHPRQRLPTGRQRRRLPPQRRALAQLLPMVSGTRGTSQIPLARASPSATTRSSRPYATTFATTRTSRLNRSARPRRCAMPDRRSATTTMVARPALVPMLLTSSW